MASASERPGYDDPDGMKDGDVGTWGLVSGEAVSDMKVLKLAQRHACSCICHEGKPKLR